MEISVEQPFSNTQLEILKAFSYQLSETDLQDLRQTLALFFANRLIKEADQVWDNEKWTDEDVDRMLVSKMRKSL